MVGVGQFLNLAVFSGSASNHCSDTAWRTLLCYPLMETPLDHVLVNCTSLYMLFKSINSFYYGCQCSSPVPHFNIFLLPESYRSADKQFEDLIRSSRYSVCIRQVERWRYPRHSSVFLWYIAGAFESQNDHQLNSLNSNGPAVKSVRSLCESSFSAWKYPDSISSTEKT